ncbi:MAG: integrase arm-type DNA-binding domain-containing protein [Burkholderiaceae bacterium]
MTLKAKQIEHAGEGMHADGEGLYLRVQASGAKGWIFRFQLNGKRREMGIGTLADVTAPEARAEAAKHRAVLRTSVDPIEARQLQIQRSAEAALQAIAGGSTFRTVAADYIASHRAGWANKKHAAQWESTLKTYAEPVIGDKVVADVNTDDVLRVLQPIWTTKTETASRVRSRIELVLSFAKAKKLRQGENPAAWRGHLDALLPRPSKVAPVRHHPAMPWSQIPKFFIALRSIDGSGARALEFAILTAARSGEVRLMTRGELDLEAKLWTIPARRMKAKRDHRVPLSEEAVKLLKELAPIEGNPYVFPGTRKKSPVSDMTLTAAIRRLNEGKDPKPWLDPKSGDEVVPHGFRSAFRDWAAEATPYPGEMAEMALAHVVGDKVEAAYRRGDMFERRRSMMQDWSTWCCSATIQNHVAAQSMDSTSS